MPRLLPISNQHNKRKPKDLATKIVFGIVILISVSICTGIAIMIYQGERDPDIIIHNDTIEIRALYGLTISISDINEISLIDKSMRELGAGTRTNGYSSTGLALKGNFTSPHLGQILLFVYSTSSPTIKLTTINNPDIYISFRNNETTKELYQKLSTINNQITP